MQNGAFAWTRENGPWSLAVANPTKQSPNTVENADTTTSPPGSAQSNVERVSLLTVTALQINDKPEGAVLPSPNPFTTQLVPRAPSPPSPPLLLLRRPLTATVDAHGMPVVVASSATSPHNTTSNVNLQNSVNVADIGEPDFTDHPNDAARIDYLKLMLTARVYDAAVETPLQQARILSARYQTQIYLKREDLQPVFSFKCRGAYNRMAQLTAEERERGVICVSAGNHAQGVALAAQLLKIRAVIVMPRASPEIKCNNVRRLGGEVLLFGDDFDQAKAECIRLAEQHKYTFIHPYDDPYVIAGQGTVAVEILRQLRQARLDAIFVCCGGGGLLAGIATYVKRIRPEVKVFGVNAEDSDAMTKSLISGHRVELREAGLFSDGTSIRIVGKEPFRLCRHYVDGMITVSNDELCAAIKDTFDDTRSILEPAGALAVAGMKKYLRHRKEHDPDAVHIAILSGANMNFDRLRFVAERARLGEQKEALMAVTLPERPGTFMQLYNVVLPRNVTELCYRYTRPEQGRLFIGFETSDRLRDVATVIEALTRTAPEIKARDVSDHDIARAHVRFGFGSGPRVTEMPRERIFRFRFPERPGTLHRLLHLVESKWNFSLMHYRNLGGDVGRMLVGIQVPVEDDALLDSFLAKVNYPYVEVTMDEIVQLFIEH